MRSLGRSWGGLAAFHLATIATPAWAQGALPGSAVPTVVVHIEADEPEVVLETRVPGPGGRAQWMPVCAGSCDRPIPLGVLYRINGDGIRASRSFELGGQPGGYAHLVAATSSSSAFTSGIVLASVGGGVVLAGLFVTLIGLLLDAVCYAGTTGCHSGDAGVITTGLIMTGVGTTGIVIGSVMVVGNARSSVQQVALRSPVLRF